MAQWLQIAYKYTSGAMLGGVSVGAVAAISTAVCLSGCPRSNGAGFLMVKIGIPLLGLDVIKSNCSVEPFLFVSLRLSEMPTESVTVSLIAI